MNLVLQTGKHPKRDELISFLKEICSVSNKLIFLEKDLKENARSPLTFCIMVDGKPNGISFSGIPSGHEFNSLILAILHSGGSQIEPR